MGLTLEQFWGSPSDLNTGMTLREFDLCAQGYQDRLKTKQELLAWHAANIINGTGMAKRAVTPDKLMGRGDGKMTPDELRAHLSVQANKNKTDLMDELPADKSVDFERYEQDYDKWMDEIYESVDT